MYECMQTEFRETKKDTVGTKDQGPGGGEGGREVEERK
jgi:hypothetical protein